MAFHVEITPLAEQDTLAILNWLIEQHADDSGLRWFHGLRDAIASLKAMPERCPLAPENATVSFELRQLLYGSSRHRYRVLFTIEGEVVQVLRVRRPGQDLLPSH